jgi:hypothetical protein
MRTSRRTTTTKVVVVLVAVAVTLLMMATAADARMQFVRRVDVSTLRLSTERPARRSQESGVQQVMCANEDRFVCADSGLHEVECVHDLDGDYGGEGGGWLCSADLRWGYAMRSYRVDCEAVDQQRVYIRWPSCYVEVEVGSALGVVSPAVVVVVAALAAVVVVVWVACAVWRRRMVRISAAWLRRRNRADKCV